MRKYLSKFLLFLGLLSICIPSKVDAASGSSVNIKISDIDGVLYYNSDSEMAAINQSHYTREGDNADVWCIDPGVYFATNPNNEDRPNASTETLHVDESVNVDNCKSSKDSSACGLMAILQEGNKRGLDFTAMNTALRLYSLMYRDNKGLKSTRIGSAYYNTAQAILNGTYSVEKAKNGKNLIFPDEDNYSSFNAGIELFKEAVDGLDVWSPDPKVITPTGPVRVKDNPVINIQVKTNLNGSTDTIKDVTATGGAIVTSFHLNTDGTLDVVADISGVTVTGNVKFTVTYESESSSKIVIYNHSVGGGRQDFASTETITNEGTFEFTIYVIPDGGPGKCPLKITENVNCDHDESNPAEIRDPEMCSILNADPSGQKNYQKTDYSNQYCKVYCRETLTFTFMDKEEAIAGRFFVHDVNAKYSNLEYLSTVILSTKQCVSDIDYDLWKKRYNEVNENLRTSWNRLKEWESYWNLASGSPTEIRPCSGCSASSCDGSSCHEDPIEVCIVKWNTGSWCETSSNGYVTCKSSSHDASGNGPSCRDHDSTSCTTTSNPDGTSSTECETDCGGTSCYSGHEGDTEDVNRNYNYWYDVYTGYLKQRDELLYLLQDCNFISNQDKLYTKKSSYYTTSGKGSYITPAQLKTYDRVIKYNPQNIVNMDYEENYPIKIDKDITDTHVARYGYSESGDWNQYCGNCNNKLETLPEVTYKEELTYWLCTGSEGGAICNNIGVTVPSNRITYINIEKETLHYQGQDFYTQVYTGNVATVPNDKGYWIPLDEHSWPVNANTPTGEYDINIRYSKLGDTNNRVVQFKDGDLTCPYQVINDLNVYDCDDGYHICYDCDGPCPDDEANLGVYFRTIDLTDVFPNSNFSPNAENSIATSKRRVGSNWANSKPVIDSIQKLGTEVWQETPRYVVTLTPSMIKSIQNYNKGTNYLDNSLTCNGLNCTSDFLNGELKSIMGNKYESYYDRDSSINKFNSLYYYKR